MSRMKLAILAIGIPGSGKTTHLSALAERYGMRRVSRDDIRRKWFGNPHAQLHKGVVRKEAEQLAKAALADDRSVIFDSTFVSRPERVRTIEKARDAGAERVVGVVFETPLEVAKAQNRQRAHVVKESIVTMMFRMFKARPPALEDGFDALYTSDQLEELERKELIGRA